ncbi:MAG: ABC-F family ATP-binding cassette domain-containing protein [Bacteroidia bacterium]|jgi:ATP-binding cassette subfamily F protein 3
MITVGNLSVLFGGKPLFEDISFMIQSRDRVGLTGKNGAGKSTLLKIIARQQEPTKGSVSVPNGYRIGYLPQEMNHNSGTTIFEEARTAFAEVLELEEEISTLSNQLETRTDYESDEYHQIIEQLNDAGQRLSLLGSGSVDGETEKVLLGLGFRSSDMNRQMDEFSGGWKMRVELAKILLQSPDAVLLDEPTNHLDIEAIQWLEGFLSGYPGAVILVSHDRAFLDAVTNRTIEITVGRIEDYKASYSKYVELRKERRELQMAAYLNQKKMIEDTEKFIDRFRYKASKAVQVQSRIKQLDKVDRIEVEEEDNSAIHFRFPSAPRSGKVAVNAAGVAKSFGEKRVLNKLDFMVERGDKIAFVGRNGEGKTTLSKIITGSLEHEGLVELGHNVELGYFAQNQADTLNPSLTVMETLEQVAGTTTTQQIRNILGAFLFGGEAVDKKVKVLSGGEKGRLAIARLLMQPVNLLVLDEPTNHLDMRSKDILKEALKQYDGTLILVSHDREFLDGLCNKVFEFKSGEIREFPGGIFDFLQSRKLETLKQLEQAKAAEKKPSTPVAEPKKTANPENEKQRKQLQTKIRNAEEQIVLLETKVEKLEAELANPETYADTARSTQLLNEHTKTKAELDSAMQNWESIVLQLDSL